METSWQQTEGRGTEEGWKKTVKTEEEEGRMERQTRREGEDADYEIGKRRQQLVGRNDSLQGGME